MRMKSEELRVQLLTEEERETLERLVSSGKTVFWAPIEIESDEQMEALGITRKQCRVWRFGIVDVWIHLTPVDQETCEFLLESLRAKHKHVTREKRCMIPGERRPLIRCPECNACTHCPFPEARDRYSSAPLSLDSMMENGVDIPIPEDVYGLVETRDEIEAVSAAIKAVNPKYLRAITLYAYYGMSVKEIAAEMRETPRNVYYYIEQARKIGSKFKV